MEGVGSNGGHTSPSSSSGLLSSPPSLPLSRESFTSSSSSSWMTAESLHLDTSKHTPECISDQGRSIQLINTSLWVYFSLCRCLLAPPTLGLG